MIGKRRFSSGPLSVGLGLVSLGLASLACLLPSSSLGEEPKDPSSLNHVTPKVVWHLVGHTRWVRSLAFTPSGDTLISSSDDGKVLSWNLDLEKKSSARPKLVRSLGSPVTALAVSPDGKKLAIGTWDGDLEMLVLRMPGSVRSFEGHRETVTALDFHPSGDYLASGSADDTLVVWDASSGEELLSCHQGNEYDVTTVAFDPTGTRILTGDGENQIKIWDAETGDEVETLLGHTETIVCASYSPDGKTILSGGWDDNLRLWETRAGQLIREFKTHRDDITAALFADNDLLVSASEDNTVRIWAPETGRLLTTIELPETAYAIAYNSNQHLLAVGGSKGCTVYRLIIDKKL